MHERRVFIEDVIPGLGKTRSRILLARERKLVLTRTGPQGIGYARANFRLLSRPSKAAQAVTRRAGITSSTSGLISPGTNNIGKYVPPRRIELFDQLYFPIPPPPLHGTLALSCSGGVAVLLKVDEAVHPVLARKAFDHACAMLPRSPGKVTGHANIKNAARFAGGDVNPEPLWLFQHRLILDVIPGLRNFAVLRCSPGNAGG